MGIPPFANAPSSISGTPGLSTQLSAARKPYKFIGRHSQGLDFGTLVVGTDYSNTGRAAYKNCGPITVLQAFFGNRSLATAGELGSNVNGTIVQASIENSTTYVPLVKNGQIDITIQPTTQGAYAWTDPIGVTIPAAQGFFARSFVRIPKQPTGTPTATAVLGGALTAGTYYYKLTTVDNGFESAASTEFSGTTASVNLALTLAWAQPTYGQFINIYRGTSTGAEQFLTQVPIQSTSFTDLGYSATNSAVTPPAGYAPPNGRYMLSNTEYCNVQANGYSGLNLVDATGAITGASGPSNITLYHPAAIIGDDYRNPSYMCLGDSKIYGTGFSSSLIGQYSQWLSNWFDAGFVNGQLAGSYNGGAPSSAIKNVISGQESFPAREQLLEFADYIISSYGQNDLTTQTWQQIATNTLILAQVCWSKGKRFIVTTLTPFTTSTDNFITATNQTVSGSESVRTNFNLWVRAGCQTSSGTPVLSGGVASPYVYTTFDCCTPLEVNSSNVLTPNGGFWLAPASAAGTITFGTGSTTTALVTSSTQTIPSSASRGLCNSAIQVTSGAANGQSCAVFRNLTTTAITVYANGANGAGAVPVTGLTIAPSNGDTANYYFTNTVDGIHPGPYGSALIGAAHATFVTANIVPYGYMLGT